MRKLAIALIAMLVCSVAVKAQGKTALDAYDKWKIEASKHLGSTENIHYGLAALTQRVDIQTARLNFVVVGQLPSLDLEIRPLKIQRDINGTILRENVGETTKAHQQLLSDKTNPNPIADLTTIIPIDNSANALEVEWKFNARGEEGSFKLILPLEDVPSAHFLGIIPSAPGANRDIPLCPIGCYEVSGSNDRCGFFYKCCGSLIGNSIDYTACTASCGQTCEPE